jgi:hypothetical protein
MTVQKSIDIFNILLDKTGTPYLSDEEVVDLLNMALRGEFLNRLFPDSLGGTVNFEFDANTLANIQPLIYTLSISMNGSGVLTTAAINTALQTATGNADDVYFRIASIGWTTGSDTFPVKFVKNNDRWSFEKNIFKKPSATNPRYTLTAQGLKFYPTSASTVLTVTVIKQPVLFDAEDLAAECELADYQMYTIISHALKLAGISLNATELVEDVRLAALQTNQ